MIRTLRRILYNHKRCSIFHNWQLDSIIDLFMPISEMLCYSLISYYVYGSKNIFQWILGNSLLLVAFKAIYGVGSELLSEKAIGTLPLIIASPTSLYRILIEDAISVIIDSGITVIVGVSLMSLFFHLSWTLKLILFYVLTIIITQISTMSLGMLLSCYILVGTEVNLVANLLQKLLLIFSGACFPLSLLPNQISWISNIIPLTHCIKALHILIADPHVNSGRITYFLFIELVIACIYILITIIVLSIIEKDTIKNGNYDLY